MPRLVLTWDQPHHLAAEEADRWLRDAVGVLLTLPEVRRVELVHLDTPSDAHPQPCEWLCELELAEDADVAACLRRGPCAEWLRDLRLLGMRPAVAVASESVVLP